MSSELQTLNERIAERIGKDLVDLIPANQWQELVDKEIEKFMLVSAPEIINELMMKAYKDKATAIIDELTRSSGWNSTTQQYVCTELEKFIGESSGVIVAGMLSPSMQMVLQDLRGRLGY